MARWLWVDCPTSRFGRPLDEPPREQDPDRSCGPCNVCCHAEMVYEPRSKRGEDCPHLRKSEEGGCAIHATRHQTCRDFLCRWLEGWGDDAARPDRCGLVFFSGNDECVRATEARPGAADSPEGQAAIAAWLDAGADVGLYRHGSDAAYPEWITRPRG